MYYKSSTTLCTTTCTFTANRHGGMVHTSIHTRRRYVLQHNLTPKLEYQYVLESHQLSIAVAAQRKLETERRHLVVYLFICPLTSLHKEWGARQDSGANRKAVFQKSRQQQFQVAFRPLDPHFVRRCDTSPRAVAAMAPYLICMRGLV